MSKSSFRIEGNLQANLVALPHKQRAAMIAAANYTAPLAESFMKSTASWTDRTGNARNGLKARVVVGGGGNKVAIVLYHSVPYGIWLEVRWGGKYAVILPALAATGPLFIEAIRRLMFEE